MAKNSIIDAFDKYSQQLLSFIQSRTSTDDAEDVLQDVFLRFIEADKVSPITQVASWLYQTARNKIIDNSRKKHEERMLDSASQDDEDSFFIHQLGKILVDDDKSPEKEYLRDAVWEELEDALEDLPKEQRYVFEQTEFEGRSFKDLSAELGVSVNTLISRKHYAVKILRNQLREIYEDLVFND